MFRHLALKSEQCRQSGEIFGSPLNYLTPIGQWMWVVKEGIRWNWCKSPASKNHWLEAHLATSSDPCCSFQTSTCFRGWEKGRAACLNDGDRGLFSVCHPLHIIPYWRWGEWGHIGVVCPEIRHQNRWCEDGEWLGWVLKWILEEVGA